MSQTDAVMKLYQQFSPGGKMKLCDMFFKCKPPADVVDVAILFRDLSEETRTNALEYMTDELEHDKQHVSNTTPSTPPHTAHGKPSVAFEVVELGRQVGFEAFRGVLACHRLMLSKGPDTGWPPGLDAILDQTLSANTLADIHLTLRAMVSAGPPETLSDLLGTSEVGDALQGLLGSLLKSDTLLFPPDSSEAEVAAEAKKMMEKLKAGPATKDGALETGWLIEKQDTSGLCLGFGCGKGTQWTTPSLAIRFSRVEDATGVALLLVPNDSVRITEHQWS